MRVLIVSQYFTPEITAASMRLRPIAAGLSMRGHDVEVLCQVPNHPHGVVPPDFRGRPVFRRRLDGFRVNYVWVRADPSRAAVDRVLSYGSFAGMASAVGTLMERPDAIFASSPPLPVGVAGAVLSARHRAPWVFDVRDVWPEVAVALGELRSPRLLAWAERLERRLYASADAITTPTEPFRRQIATFGEPGKVHLLPNGTTRMWLKAGEAEVEGSELGTGDRFTWTFAGNLGLAQGLEAAVDAAGLLGDGFSLLLLGDGPDRERLRSRAEGQPPGAVVFRDAVDPPVAARMMRASDALLVSLADRPALHKPVPSKLYDCCAMGRPVVVSAPGEVARLAESRGVALAVPPGDPVALAGAVRRLREDARLRERLSDAGRGFAAEHLREEQVDTVESLLESLA